MNRLLITAALCLPFGAWAVDAPDESEVQAVLRAMREEISSRPSRVLIAVEDALTMNERAACEIVKEAITSTKADARLVGEIVFTALKHAPAMTATIVECATATAPGAVREIQQAVTRALGSGTRKSADTAISETGGDKVPPEESPAGDSASGKESSGKGAALANPVPTDKTDIIDFFLAGGSVGVGGIYLIVPAHTVNYCQPGAPCCSGELSPSCLKP